MTSTMGTTLTGGWSESAESLVFFRGKEADDGQQSTDDSGAVRTPKEEERRQLKPANFTAGELQFCASQEELKSLQDLFVEGCCSLYHDILDCLNDDTDSESNTPRTSDFVARQAKMRDEGAKLRECVPEMSEAVELRLITVDKAMEQLCLRRLDSDTSSGDEKAIHTSALSQLRKWLQWTEERLGSVDQQNLDRMSDKQVRRIAADQQILQLEIETDGRALVQSLQRQLDRLTAVGSNSGGEDCSPRVNERRKRTLGLLTRAWHKLWIKSIELQCKIEERYNRIEQSPRERVQSDPELAEPSAKRRRLVPSVERQGVLQQLQQRLNSLEAEVEEEDDGEESDTIPFAADEYESIMDDNGNLDLIGDVHPDPDFDNIEYRNEKGQIVHNRAAMVGSSDAIATLKSSGVGPWEVVPQDIGYSSGENSIHEALCDVGIELKVTRSESDEFNNNNGSDSDDVDGAHPDDPHRLRADRTPSRNPNGQSGSSSPDLARRKRIQGSPVKSYYKTVPLDDTGATDTETPRSFADNASATHGGAYLSAFKYDQKESAANTLTDSLIVQVAGGDISAQNDIEDVLSLLDDDAFDQNRSSQFEKTMEKIRNSSQGTKWREFRSGTNSIGRSSSRTLGRDSATVDDDKHSCDAGSEQSDVEEKTPDRPNESADVPFTSTPVGSNCSLKRRLRAVRPRADRPHSLTGGFKLPLIDLDASACASEMEVSVHSTWSNVECTPLMSQSLCAPGRHRGTAAGRRKLRARRMPRSMSDGEHLGMWLNAQSSFHTPAASEAPVNDGDELSTKVVEEEDPLTERMEADGGSAEEVTGAEQSDAAPAWEWDDYNPPAHNEDGDGEQRLDDSRLTDFGDDYRLHMRAMTGSPRQSPIGVSSRDTSDSEPATDLRELLNESTASFRKACDAFDGQRRGVQNGHGLADLTATCETNIRCLQAITKSALCSPKARCPQEDYSRITSQLKEWQDLLFAVKSLSMKKAKQVRRPAPADANGETTALVHGEMARLAQSLKQLIEESALNRSFTSTVGCLRSLDDVVDTQELFQDLHSRLQAERKRLRMLLKTYEMATDVTDDEIKSELEQLCHYCDGALESCAHQISELGRLKQQWIDWCETKEMMERLLGSLERKMTNLELSKSHPEMVDDKPDVKVVYSELELCQDRMNRLETMCNYLVSSCDQTPSTSSSSAGVTPDFRTELTACGEALSDLRERFKDLPDGWTLCSKEATLARRKSNDHTTTRRKSDDHSSARRKSDDSTTRRKRSKPRQRQQLATNRGVLRVAWDCVSASRPIQLCLVLLLLVGGLMQFWPGDNEPVNNWRNAWGPQLNYVRGPPPS